VLGFAGVLIAITVTGTILRGVVGKTKPVSELVHMRPSVVETRYYRDTGELVGVIKMATDTTTQYIGQCDVTFNQPNGYVGYLGTLISGFAPGQYIEQTMTFYTIPGDVRPAGHFGFTNCKAIKRQ
jgi:hypothetical protein